MIKRDKKQIGHLKAGVLVSYEMSGGLRGRRKTFNGLWVCFMTVVRHCKGGTYTVKYEGFKVRGPVGTMAVPTGDIEWISWKATIRSESAADYRPEIEPGSQMDLLFGDILRAKRDAMFGKQESEKQAKVAKAAKQYNSDLMGAGFNLFGILILEMVKTAIKDFPIDLLEFVGGQHNVGPCAVLGFGKHQKRLAVITTWSADEPSPLNRVLDGLLPGMKIVTQKKGPVPEDIFEQACGMKLFGAKETYAKVVRGQPPVTAPVYNGPLFDFDGLTHAEAPVSAGPAHSYALGGQISDLANNGHLETMNDLYLVSFDEQTGLFWMQID